MAVLPFGRSGIISGAMLGLGRALGETMAVAIVLSVSGGDHVQPDQLEQPVDDRGEHRAAVPGLVRARGERADRVGPRAVRRSPCWSTSLAALHRQPPPRVLGSELMSHRHRARAEQTLTERLAAAAAASLTGAELPGWAPWAILGGAVVVVGGVLAAHRPQHRPGGRRRTAVVYALATYLTSRVGRGPAQGHGPAGDRRGHVGVPARHGPAGVGGGHGARQRPRPVRRRSSSPTRCAASSGRAAAATTRSSAR